MRKTGRWAAVLLAAAAFTGAVHAQAQAGAWGQVNGIARQAALTRQVEALLRAGVEATDFEAAVVALGEAGEQALRAVFERADALAYVRLRALAALQGFETEGTARYFEALVRAAQPPTVEARTGALERNFDARLGELHPARSPLVLRRALEGLIALHAHFQLRLDAAALAGCLAHGDAHVRRAAADLSLALDDRPGADEIAQALRAQLVRERSTMVRGHLEKALTSRPVRPAGPR